MLENYEIKLSLNRSEFDTDLAKVVADSKGKSVPLKITVDSTSLNSDVKKAIGSIPPSSVPVGFSLDLQSLRTKLDAFVANNPLTLQFNKDYSSQISGILSGIQNILDQSPLKIKINDNALKSEFNSIIQGLQSDTNTVTVNLSKQSASTIKTEVAEAADSAVGSANIGVDQKYFKQQLGALIAVASSIQANSVKLGVDTTYFNSQVAALKSAVEAGDAAKIKATLDDTSFKTSFEELQKQTGAVDISFKENAIEKLAELASLVQETRKELSASTEIEVTSNFDEIEKEAQALLTSLNAIEAQKSLTVEVKSTVEDIKGKVEAFQASLALIPTTEKNVTIKATLTDSLAEINKVASDLKALTDVSLTLKSTSDIGTIITDAAALKLAFKDLPNSADVSLNVKTTGSLEGIKEISEEIKKVDRTVDVDVNVENQQALTGLEATQTAISGIDKTVSIDVKLDGSVAATNTELEGLKTSVGAVTTALDSLATGKKRSVVVQSNLIALKSLAKDFTTQLAELDKKDVSVAVNAVIEDIAPRVESLNAELNKIPNNGRTIEIKATMSQALVDLNSVLEVLRSLDKPAKPSVSFDGTEVLADLNTVNAAFDALSTETKTVTVQSEIGTTATDLAEIVDSVKKIPAEVPLEVKPTTKIAREALAATQVAIQGVTREITIDVKLSASSAETVKTLDAINKSAQVTPTINVESAQKAVGDQEIAQLKLGADVAYFTEEVQKLITLMTSKRLGDARIGINLQEALDSLAEVKKALESADPLQLSPILNDANLKTQLEGLTSLFQDIPFESKGLSEKTVATVTAQVNEVKAKAVEVQNSFDAAATAAKKVIDGIPAVKTVTLTAENTEALNKLTEVKDKAEAITDVSVAINAQNNTEQVLEAVRAGIDSVNEKKAVVTVDAEDMGVALATAATEARINKLDGQTAIIKIELANDSVTPEKLDAIIAKVNEGESGKVEVSSNAAVAELSKISKELEGLDNKTITISGDVQDASNKAASLLAELDKVTDKTVKVTVTQPEGQEAALNGIQTAISNIADKTVTISINNNTAQVLTEVQTELGKVVDKTVTLSANTTDLTNNVTSAKNLVDSVTDKSVTISLNNKDGDAITGVVEEINKKLEDLTDKTVTLDVEAQGLHQAVIEANNELDKVTNKNVTITADGSSLEQSSLDAVNALDKVGDRNVEIKAVQHNSVAQVTGEVLAALGQLKDKDVKISLSSAEGVNISTIVGNIQSTLGDLSDKNIEVNVTTNDFQADLVEAKNQLDTVKDKTVEIQVASPNNVKQVVLDTKEIVESLEDKTVDIKISVSDVITEASNAKTELDKIADKTVNITINKDAQLFSNVTEITDQLALVKDKDIKITADATTVAQSATQAQEQLLKVTDRNVVLQVTTPNNISQEVQDANKALSELQDKKLSISIVSSPSEFGTVITDAVNALAPLTDKNIIINAKLADGQNIDSLISGVKTELEKLPDNKQISVNLTSEATTLSQIDELKKAFETIEKEQNIEVKVTSNAVPAINEVNEELARVKSQTATVSIDAEYMGVSFAVAFVKKALADLEGEKSTVLVDAEIVKPQEAPKQSEIQDQIVTIKGETSDAVNKITEVINLLAQVVDKESKISITFPEVEKAEELVSKTVESLARLDAKNIIISVNMSEGIDAAEIVNVLNEQLNQLVDRPVVISASFPDVKVVSDQVTELRNELNQIDSEKVISIRVVSDVEIAKLAQEVNEDLKTIPAEKVVKLKASTSVGNSVKTALEHLKKLDGVTKTATLALESTDFINKVNEVLGSFDLLRDKGITISLEYAKDQNPETIIANLIANLDKLVDKTVTISVQQAQGTGIAQQIGDINTELDKLQDKTLEVKIKTNEDSVGLVEKIKAELDSLIDRNIQIAANVDQQAAIVIKDLSDALLLLSDKTVNITVNVKQADDVQKLIQSIKEDFAEIDKVIDAFKSKTEQLPEVSFSVKTTNFQEVSGKIDELQNSINNLKAVSEFELFGLLNNRVQEATASVEKLAKALTDVNSVDGLSKAISQVGKQALALKQETSGLISEIQELVSKRENIEIRFTFGKLTASLRQAEEKIAEFEDRLKVRGIVFDIKPRVEDAKKAVEAAQEAVGVEPIMVRLEFDVDKAKLTELKEFAKQHNIKPTTGKNKADFQNAIREYLDNRNNSNLSQENTSGNDNEDTKIDSKGVEKLNLIATKTSESLKLTDKQLESFRNIQKEFAKDAQKSRDAGETTYTRAKHTQIEKLANAVASIMSKDLADGIEGKFTMGGVMPTKAALANGAASRETGGVYLSEKARRGVVSPKMRREDLRTLVHELRHVAQFTAMKAGKSVDLIKASDAQNETEKGFVENVRKNYKDHEQDIEVDAFLYAEREVNRIAKELGITFTQTARNSSVMKDELDSLKQGILNNIQALSKQKEGTEDYLVIQDRLDNLTSKALHLKNDYKKALEQEAAASRAATEAKKSLIASEKERKEAAKKTRLSGDAAKLPPRPKRVREDLSLEQNSDIEDSSNHNDLENAVEDRVKRLRDEIKEAQRVVDDYTQQINALGSVGMTNRSIVQMRNEAQKRLQSKQKELLITETNQDQPEESAEDLNKSFALLSGRSRKLSEAVHQANIRLTRYQESLRKAQERAQRLASKPENNLSRRAAEERVVYAQRRVEDQQRKVKSLEADQRELAGKSSTQRNARNNLGREVASLSGIGLLNNIQNVLEVQEAIEDAKEAGIDFKELWENIKNPVGLIATAGTLGAITLAAIKVVSEFQKLEKVGKAVGLQNLDNTMTRLKKLSTDLGVDLASTTKQFTKFSASTATTSLAPIASDLFTNVTTYGSTVGANDDEMSRAFNALQQIAAKGKVSLEELNGQLAEALPGASTLAAKALGITQGELFKLAEGGNLLATDLLPAFSRELKKVAAAGAGNKLTITQEIQRLQQAMSLFIANSGEPMVVGLTGALSGLNNVLGFLSHNAELAETLVFALALAMGGYGVATLKAAIATEGFAAKLGKVLAVGAKALGWMLAATAAAYTLNKVWDSLEGGLTLEAQNKAFEELDNLIEEVEKRSISAKSALEDLLNAQGQTNGKDNLTGKDTLDSLNQGDMSTIREEAANQPFYSALIQDVTNLGLATQKAMFGMGKAKDDAKKALSEYGELVDEVGFSEANVFMRMSRLATNKAKDTRELNSSMDLTITKAELLANAFDNIDNPDLLPKEGQQYVEVIKQIDQMEALVEASEKANLALRTGLSSDIFDASSEGFDRLKAQVESLTSMPGFEDFNVDNYQTTEELLAAINSKSTELRNNLSELQGALPVDLDQLVALRDKALEASKSMTGIAKQETQQDVQDLNYLIQKLEKNMGEAKKEADKLGDALQSLKANNQLARSTNDIAEATARVAFQRQALNEGIIDQSQLETGMQKISMAGHIARMKQLQDEKKGLDELAASASQKDLANAEIILGKKFSQEGGKIALDINQLSIQEIETLISKGEQDLSQSFTDYLKEVQEMRPRFATEMLDHMEGLDKIQLDLRSKFAEADDELNQRSEELSTKFKDLYKSLGDNLDDLIKGIASLSDELQRQIEDRRMSLQEARNKKETNDKIRAVRAKVRGLDPDSYAAKEAEIIVKKIQAEADKQLNALNQQKEFTNADRGQEDTLDRLEKLFDSYVSKMEEFNKNLADLVAEQARINADRQQLENEKQTAINPSLAAFDKGVEFNGLFQSINSASNAMKLSQQGVIRATNSLYDQRQREGEAYKAVEAENKRMANAAVNMTQAVQDLPVVLGRSFTESMNITVAQAASDGQSPELTVLIQIRDLLAQGLTVNGLPGGEPQVNKQAAAENYLNNLANQRDEQDKRLDSLRQDFETAKKTGQSPDILYRQFSTDLRQKQKLDRELDNKSFEAIAKGLKVEDYNPTETNAFIAEGVEVINIEGGFMVKDHNEDAPKVLPSYAIKENAEKKQEASLREVLSKEGTTEQANRFKKRYLEMMPELQGMSDDAIQGVAKAMGLFYQYFGDVEDRLRRAMKDNPVEVVQPANTTENDKPSMLPTYQKTSSNPELSQKYGRPINLVASNNLSGLFGDANKQNQVSSSETEVNSSESTLLAQQISNEKKQSVVTDAEAKNAKKKAESQAREVNSLQKQEAILKRQDADAEANAQLSDAEQEVINLQKDAAERLSEFTKIITENSQELPATLEINQDLQAKAENLQTAIDGLTKFAEGKPELQKAFAPDLAKAQATLDENKKLQEENTNLYNRLKAQKGTQKKIDDNNLVLDNKYSSTLRKNQIERDNLLLEQQVKLLDEVIKRRDELIKEGLSNKDAEKQAEAEVRDRFKKERDNLNSNLDTLSNKLKTSLGDLMGGIFSFDLTSLRKDPKQALELKSTERRQEATRETDINKLAYDLMDSGFSEKDAMKKAEIEVNFRYQQELDRMKQDTTDVLGEAITGLLDSALASIQSWAGEQLSSFLLDTLFNKNKGKEQGADMAEKFLEGFKEETSSSTSSSSPYSTYQTPTDNANKPFGSFNGAANTAGYLGAAGITAVSKNKKGAGIGAVLGGLAGSFFGMGGLGSMLGAGIGGLFAKGGRVDPNNPVELELSEAMRIERLMSGRKPMLGVLHEGEQVLSTKNGDAEAFRRLQSNGIWDSLKSFANGGTVGANSPMMMQQRIGNSVSNSNDNSRTANTNITYNVNLKDNALVPMSESQKQSRLRNIFA